MTCSQGMHTAINPALRCKMPLLDGAVASNGLSKPINMSNYLGKQMLQYRGACYVYDPRGKDGAQFTSPWSKSKTSLLDGRHSVTHLSGMERENNTFYRQDSNSSAEGQSNPSLSPHAPVKQGFKLYTKSPGISSPTAATPVALRKPTTMSDTSSPLSENQTYLAIPKPVYAHNPCCDEMGCVRGRYSVEHGLPGIPNSVRKHNWLQTDPHYKDNSTIQKKAGDTVLQHGGLRFEPSAEQLQRIPVDYSAGRARAFPAVVDPNYSSYPCTLIRTHFGSLSEQSQQKSPRGYPCLYPSHYTYEHMTSDVYQEHSPMSKYGHLTQHPMFYYSQPDVEVETRTQCKDTDSKTREDVPVMLKHAIPRPQEHYVSPPLLHSDIPYPFACTETFPNHALMQGLGYPYYAIPRSYSNANQCTAPFKKQETSDRTNYSPSGTCIDYAKACATNIHQVKLNPRPHVDQTHTSRPDRASASRRASESDVSRSRIQNNRYCSPQSLLNVVRNQNYSSYEAQVSPGTQLPHLAHHRSDGSNAAVQSSLSVRKIIYSPPASPQSKHNVTHPLTSPGLKVPLKRSISHTASPIRIKEEQGSDEVEFLSKKPKVEMENAQLHIRSDSPPMPVINNVFSLAPSQAHLQASGVLFPGRVAQRPVQPSERCEVQTKQDLNEKRIGQDKEQPVCPVTSTEKPVGDIAEFKNVKVEKDLSEKDPCVETAVCQKDCSVLGIDKDPEKTGSIDGGHIPEVKKCDSDKLESQLSFSDKKETSEEPVPVNVIVQINSSAEGAQCTVHEQVTTPQPGSTPPPQPSTPKLNFRNIPPHCLKLSTYKIVLPDVNSPSLAPPRENPSAQPTTENILKLDLQTPVRKHFFELHHSLYKLINKSVFASSEQELRSWLSRLDPTEASAPHAKVKKVSCLLGVKARELWFNEGIKSALQDLLQRLNEYIAQDRCPFPHVMRTGAVFLPMLVVKELLFPMVQSNYIDQVLQEHKIELRPTTLSEEKILIQLHKRACSSRLRKLISLKHLPNIYADVVNVLFYCCVTKYLGLDGDEPDSTVKEEVCEEMISGTPVVDDTIASPASPADSESPRPLTDKKSRTKSRVKSSSRRMFLDDSLSDEENVDDAGGVVLNTFGPENMRGHESEGTEKKGNDCMDAEQGSSLMPLITTCENSWTCPLTFEDLPPSPNDSETQESSSPQPVGRPSGSAKPAVRSTKCSGMVLKLRRMFSCNRKKARYQAVSDSPAFADASASRTDTSDESSEAAAAAHKMTAEVTRRWQRAGSFSHALRPLRNASQRKRRSFLKIKYCPYLSACHSAEHRRHLVLRSAVQRAKRAMRFYYPDLVGKRIRHLYEEDDKSEVWYRGEVLRIHEAHANPLKTIFEVRYDSEPEWRYYLELLIDYKKGWLKIEE